MEVCFFHFSMQAGGIERNIALLSQKLVMGGNHVTVVTIDNRKSFYALPDGVEHICLNLTSNSNNLLQAVNNNIKRILAFKRVAKRHNFDVVMSFGVNTELIALRARGNMKYKVIGSERTNPFVEVPSYWTKHKKKTAEKCDGFVFQTIGASKYYSESVRAKGIIIQNGIDTSKVIEASEGVIERQGFCAVGRVDKDKCFDDLLKSFVRFHQYYPDEILDIFGDGPEREKLIDLVKELGLESSVFFRGKSECIFDEYAKHRYFVMTSQREGFPNVLLEALASGCVCISSDCDFGPREMIINGENGFLVTPHDIDAFTERMICVYRDGKLADKLSCNAVKIRDTNSIDSIGEQFCSYLHCIVNK